MKKCSHLYALQPDPFDVTQRKFLRVCVFKDVKNAVELRELLRNGDIDAAMIQAELVRRDNPTCYPLSNFRCLSPSSCLQPPTEVILQVIKR